MASAAQLASWRRRIARLRRQLPRHGAKRAVDTLSKIAALERKVARAELQGARRRGRS